MSMVNYSNDFQITKDGIYFDMPSEIYHADPCPTPSLSNSLIRDLLDRSPKHAVWKHPKLNQNAGIVANNSMNRGTLLHNLILGCGSEIEVIHADNFLTKKAKGDRDQALSEGKTPILEKDYDEIKKCSEIAIEKIANHPACEGFFNTGHSEAVIAWQEDNIWCRGMVDRLPQDHNFPLFDLKGTDNSASPIKWEKRLLEVYRTQGIFYNRGLSKIEGIKRPSMRFIVIEMFASFEITVFDLSEELEEIATNEVQRAIQIWQHSTRTKEWPGYPNQIVSVLAKPWIINQTTDQESIEEARGLR